MKSSGMYSLCVASLAQPYFFESHSCGCMKQLFIIFIAVYFHFKNTEALLEWHSENLLSYKSNENTIKNCQNQILQTSGNKPKIYSNLKSIYSRKTIEF